MSEYIDRQAAINALSRGSGCGASCYRALKTLPSADVQPVIHARWEIGTGFRWRCSKCGGLTYIPSKFCFNCGARMDSEGRNDND